LTTFLCLLPVLVLALPLLARRYPGERVLVALRAEEHVRWPHPRTSMAPRRAFTVAIASGGLLLGCGLAVRPPPFAAR
jgi:hypothetical protein